jgi:hypothetical protein
MALWRRVIGTRNNQNPMIHRNACGTDYVDELAWIRVNQDPDAPTSGGSGGEPGTCAEVLCLTGRELERRNIGRSYLIHRASRPRYRVQQPFEGAREFWYE